MIPAQVTVLWSAILVPVKFLRSEAREMCGKACAVIRCNGCAGTDWSAFTWRWTAPAAAGSLQKETSTIRRTFGANDRSMIYPGAGSCQCTWLTDGGDTAEDTLGTLNPLGAQFAIPSIGALEYRRIPGNLFRWRLTLTRWYYSWNWSAEQSRYYGNGWGWARDWSEHDCSAGFGNPYWGGYGGFGWNGWGWGYGGLANWNYYYGEFGSLDSVTYSLPDGVSMDCKGATVRFVLDDQPDNPDFNPDEWPSFVDIARVQI